MMHQSTNYVGIGDRDETAISSPKQQNLNYMTVRYQNMKVAAFWGSVLSGTFMLMVFLGSAV
jgi:hypothetical protein